jgi:hypothetical protein
MTGMPEKKRLTIGVTVNLDHYENLRIDVEGEVSTGGNADDLIRFLDQTLAGLGRTDPATAERVDSYRWRVLAKTASHNQIVYGEAGSTVGAENGQAPVSVIRSPEATATPDPHVMKPSGTGTIERVEKIIPSRSTVPDTGIPCATCGNSISLSEQKASQLFTGKNLCRNCLKTAR